MLWFDVLAIGAPVLVLTMIAAYYAGRRRAGISVVRSFELELDPAERQLSLLPREPDGHIKVQEPKS